MTFFRGGMITLVAFVWLFSIVCFQKSPQIGSPSAVFRQASWQSILPGRCNRPSILADQSCSLCSRPGQDEIQHSMVNARCTGTVTCCTRFSRHWHLNAIIYWYLEVSIWYLLHGNWCKVLGTDLNAICVLVLGSQYMVLGAWYLVMTWTPCVLVLVLLQFLGTGTWMPYVYL